MSSLHDDEVAAAFAGELKKKKKSKAKKTETLTAAVDGDLPVQDQAEIEKDTAAMFDDLKKKKSKAAAVVVQDIVDEEVPPPVQENDEVPVANEDDMFSGLKKKKKKKTTFVDDDEATTEDPIVPPVESIENEAPAVIEPEDSSSMFSDLKKKKKKKATTESQDGAHAETDFDATFGEKKKKKKSDMAAFEALLKDGEETQNDGVSFGQSEGAEGETESNAASKLGQEAWLSSNRDYTYNELLTRVFNIIRLNNPERAQGGTVKYNIVAPQILKEGSKKTSFANLVDFCRRMRRTPDHLVQFLFAELGTSGSIDGNQRLIIKGKFQQKQIENVLKRYIVEYVTCKTCKSAETVLTKENRLFFLQCESCGSSRSVSAIKTGFVAQTARRSAQRAAAGQ
ncbi:hypothetical protein BDV3_005168 [Batrachochytrium dendrobatidis]|nr:translation initiation factor eIF-2 beta subunit [Batrachochytrium dendrobatidis]OAJ40718.1 hypothetical protein BDEG_24423 [Batrachochytrium dendrobatidis JEL423]